MGNTDKGWISLHRSLLDHWLWKEKPFDRKSAWIDILLMVNHQDSKYLLRGKLAEVKRGQCGTSISKLALRWGWSRKKVRTFLRTLEEDGMVTVKGSTQGTTLTVINYGLFQNQGPTKGPAKEQQREQRRNSRGNTNNNDRTMKNNENKSLPSEEENVGYEVAEDEWEE